MDQLSKRLNRRLAKLAEWADQPALERESNDLYRTRNLPPYQYKSACTYHPLELPRVYQQQAAVAAVAATSAAPAAAPAAGAADDAVQEEQGEGDEEGSGGDEEDEEGGDDGDEEGGDEEGERGG